MHIYWKLAYFTSSVPGADNTGDWLSPGSGWICFVYQKAPEGWNWTDQSLLRKIGWFISYLLLQQQKSPEILGACNNTHLVLTFITWGLRGSSAGLSWAPVCFAEFYRTPQAFSFQDPGTGATISGASYTYGREQTLKLQGQAMQVYVQLCLDIIYITTAQKPFSKANHMAKFNVNEAQKYIFINMKVWQGNRGRE